MLLRIYYQKNHKKGAVMNNASLSSILLIAMSSFSLQAMLFESPEAAVEFYSSMPLSSIEKALILDEIKQTGPATVRDKITQSRLKIDQTFSKRCYATDPLTKQIFDKAEQIETKAKSTPKRDTTIAHNYFGIATRYDAKGSDICVRSTIWNTQQALQVVDSYKE